MIFFNDRRRKKQPVEPPSNDDWGLGIAGKASTPSKKPSKAGADDMGMAPRSGSISESANRGTRQPSLTADPHQRHGYREDDPKIIELRKNFPNLPDPLPPALVAERAKNEGSAERIEAARAHYRMLSGDF